MGRFDRWLYKQSIIWQRLLERLDAAWCSLFISSSGKSRQKYQIRELLRLLTEHMEQDVFATYEQNRFVIVIRSQAAVIAHITHRTRNPVFAKSTYVSVELNPRDVHRKAFFQAAFLGEEVVFRELALLLTNQVK